jgi:hypothetical protein
MRRMLAPALVFVILAVGAVRAGSATLQVQVSGNGTVTSTPDGIDCPTTCSDSFDSGMRVVLTAHPAAGEAFLGWGGACSGSTATCAVTMDVGKNLGARFTPGTLPALTVDDVSTSETNFDTDAVLTVTLAPASLETVTVHYATADGTADSTDYGQASGTLTFPPGVTSVRLPIIIKGDALDEPDETFFVDLSSPEHATIGDGRGTVTIVDSDPPPIRLIDAFVDARWQVHRSYTRVTRFAVHAPAGAAVKVHCSGSGCRKKVVGAKLRPGARVVVRVTSLTQIGRYLEYRIRAGKTPRIRALCLPFETNAPKPC